jgi:predicted CXXCH cytochrome family protein
MSATEEPRTQTIDQRQERGKAIADSFGQVVRVTDRTYKVHSQSTHAIYEITTSELGWQCNCPDFESRHITCKHIWAVKFSFSLRKAVQGDSIVIRPISVHACPSCHSENVVRSGKRHNKVGSTQRFLCRECHKRFVVNLGFERMHATPQTITSAMQLYFSGESYRNVQKFLQFQGVKVSHVAIIKWVKKYVHLMEGYLDKIRPNVGDAWRTDELYVKVSGNMQYLFAMMDDETRFWIAQQVSQNKGTSDVRPMFKEAKEIAGKAPRLLISDGAANFHRAHMKTYHTKYKNSPVHFADVRFDGTVHNNKMERMNGELRDREKVMRGIKKTDSPVFKGMQLFHNYFRPHMALEGDTPAERAGIKIEGKNKWVTVIQNASKATSCRELLPS